MRSFLGAVIFYTCIPLPNTWKLNFERVARWAPILGTLMGFFLALFDWGLSWFNIPILTRSVLVVALWIGLTGGLHLDGVGDTADGLAVLDKERRLRVMQDSVTGAFGVMAIAVVLLLKVAALSELSSYRWLGLMLAAGWGRWGQVLAIAFYPYLKPTGKGAFHKQGIRLPQDVLLGLIVLLGLSSVPFVLDGAMAAIALSIGFLGMAIAFLPGYWFYRQLGGHTGDSYGAVVEWTEALMLACLTPLFHGP